MTFAGPPFNRFGLAPTAPPVWLVPPVRELLKINPLEAIRSCSLLTEMPAFGAVIPIVGLPPPDVPILGCWLRGAVGSTVIFCGACCTCWAVADIGIISGFRAKSQAAR